MVRMCSLLEKDYIHRVGRTARAGRAGKAVTLVTQYDVEFQLRLEQVLGQKLELWPVAQEEVHILEERVQEAGRLAANELREQSKDEGRKRKRLGGKDDRDRDDDEGLAETAKSKNRKRRR